MERDRGQGSPERAPKSQSKPNQPEQQPQGGGTKSPERQPLPNVWDILERKVRRSDKFLSGQMTREEYDYEGHELDRLKEEIGEKGTDRDKHILALLFYPRPSLRSLSRRLEKFQHLRSKVERLSDKELAECARKQEEEIKAFRRGEVPIMNFHPSVGDGESILYDYISKKEQSD